MRETILRILGLRPCRTYGGPDYHQGFFSINFVVSEEALKHPQIIIWELQGLQAQICKDIEERISQIKELKGFNK